MSLREQKWNGITWYFGCKGILDLLREKRDTEAPDNLLITSSTAQYRRFAHISRPNLLDLLKKNRGVFEIVEPHQPRKVYFDVDKMPPQTSLPDAKERIKAIFPDAIFAISGNHEKQSYHITLTNYHFNSAVDQQILKNWCNQPNQKALGFDPAPYSRNQQFKCINQSKPGKEVQAWIEGPKDISSHCTLFVQPDSTDARECKALSYEPISLRHIDHAQIPQQKLPLPKTCIDFKACTPIEVLQLLPNRPRGDPGALSHAHTVLAMCFAKHNNLPFTDFWHWAQSKEDSPTRLGKYLKKWDWPGTWAPKYQDMQTLLERFYPGIKKPRWALAHKRALTYTPSIVLDKKYMESTDLPAARYVALGQSMGANKTGAVIDYIESHKLKFIWITPRITLAKNTCGRFQEPVDYYKNFNKEDKRTKLKHSQRLVIGAQSLHYIENILDSDISKTLIVIDEIEFVMQDWLNSTHDNWRHDNWLVFLRLLKGCKKTIVMDAFLSSLSLDFLETIANGDIDIVNRHPRHVSHDITITELRHTEKKSRGRKSREESDKDLQAFIVHISNSLRAGKKCFVFYPFKRSSPDGVTVGIQAVRDTILSLADLTEADSRCYFAEANDEVINNLSDVNKDWDNVKLVITNSKITVGVNYDSNNYDLVYIAKAPFNSPREIAQVSARIRHIKDKQIFICYLTGKAPLFYETPSLKCIIFETLKKNYEVEFRTKGIKEIQCSFFDLAGYNIDHSQAIADINGDVFEYVRDCDTLFHWQNIEKISSCDQLDEIQNRCYVSSATQQEKLMLDKYNFIGLFPNNADEMMLRQIWDSRCVPLTYKHLQYLRHKTFHIFHNICQDLKIPALNQDWEKAEKLSRSTKDQILTMYNLNNHRDASDHVLISSLLSAYYGHDALRYDTDSRSWNWSEEYLEFTEYIDTVFEEMKEPDFELDAGL